MVRLLVVLHLHLAGRCCENLQSAKRPAQCELDPGNNMVSRRNDLFLLFLNSKLLLPRQFTRQNPLKKKLARGNAY